MNVEVRGFSAALGLYIALAASAGGPVSCDGLVCSTDVWRLAILSVCLVLLAIARPSKKFVGAAGAAFLSVGLVIALHIFFTNNPLFVANKLWGVTVSGFLATCFVACLLGIGGEQLLIRRISDVLVAILVLTIISKLGSDFWDRNTKYLFNGPIVFGWLMGFGAISNLQLYVMKREKVALIYLFLFLLATLWTLSKGPIVAFLISLLVTFFSYRKLSRSELVKIFAGLAIFVFSGYLYFGEELAGSRVGVVTEVLMSGVDDSSEGSLGIRILMYTNTFELFLQNSIFGIGAGNFGSYFSGFSYPHNVHYEILLEFGVVVFFAYVAIIIRALIGASPAFVTLICYFMVCLSFSGDLSYLRYLAPFVTIPIFRLTMKRNSVRTDTSPSKTRKSLVGMRARNRA